MQLPYHDSRNKFEDLEYFFGKSAERDSYSFQILFRNNELIISNRAFSKLSTRKGAILCTEQIFSQNLAKFFFPLIWLVAFFVRELT